ncbi:MAG: FecR domain-containing protein [Spirochaetota bacterium]
MKVRKPLVVVAAFAFAMAGCGEGQTTAPTADAEATAIPQQTARNAYLIAVSGAVEVESTAGLGEAEPGDRVDDGRLILVADRSQSDIQFGDTAFVRIYGPAQAVVRTVAGQTNRPVMEVELQSGSIGATVGPLAGTDVFRIRSPRAMYTVRGTRFHIDTTREDRLSVAEGEVAVLPRSLDVPALLVAAGDDEQIRSALVDLSEAAPSFAAGEYARLDAAAMDRSERLAAELADKMRRVDAVIASERSQLVEELITAIRLTAASLPATVVAGSAPGADVRTKLASLDETRLLPVPKDPQNLSLIDETDASLLVKFTLRTVPQAARIFIGGEYVGESVYRGVLRANQSLSIRVTKDGYRERRIQIDRARSEVLTVQLERLPPSISAESFIKAIRADDYGTVRTYVQEGGSLDVRTDDGVPAVVLASGIEPVLSGRAPDLSYHREVFRTIVTGGADLDVNFVIEGATFKLLHATILAGMAGFDVTELVEMLVDNGASIDGIIVLEGEELTPLAIAVRWALFTGETQEELIKVLLEGDASLDVAISFNNELLTLREIAVQLLEQGELEDPELIRLLRQAGALG